MTGYPWRVPDEETEGLYPGLVVHDGRKSGSITAGRSRLPLWALTGDMRNGWEAVEADYEPSRYGLSSDEMYGFLHHILQLRGDFGRLILVLANAERADMGRGMGQTPWWGRKRQRAKVRAALEDCLAALDREVPQ